MEDSIGESVLDLPFPPREVEINKFTDYKPKNSRNVPGWVLNGKKKNERDQDNREGGNNIHEVSMIGWRIHDQGK